MNTLALSPTTREGGDDYEPVTGLDQETVACVRACEAEAAAKTASDYAHVVWAYGVIWSLFALYGVLLWRRSTRQRVEIADMMSRLDQQGRGEKAEPSR
jgi:hypothetical protein